MIFPEHFFIAEGWMHIANDGQDFRVNLLGELSLFFS